MKAVKPGEGRDALDEVYEYATIAIWEKPCCSRHVRVGLQVAKDAIFKNMDLRQISSKMAEQISYLGVLAMELFSSKARTQNKVLCGTWESAAWKVVLMSSFCTPDMAQCMTQTQSTIQWIKEVFCNRYLCPNPHLRREMMRFMVLWPDKVLRDPVLGFEILHAMVLLTSRLKMQDMLPQGRPSLSGPFACLLQNFHRLGFLEVLAVQACMQVTRLHIGAEARFFAHVVRLLGEKAKVLRHMCHNASLSYLVVMEEYRHLLDTLTVLVVSDSSKIVFKLPGLRQVAAIAIAATTINLYKSSTRLAAADEARFKKLKEQLNGLLLSVNKILGKELMTNHGRTLLRAAQLADEAEFPLHDLSVLLLYEVPEGCCERFLDTVTGKVMEEPVRLISSQTVMDMSTLVGFMLFSVSWPCTIAYILLTELKREILDWKMNSSRRPQERRISSSSRSTS